MAFKALSLSLTPLQTKSGKCMSMRPGRTHSHTARLSIVQICATKCAAVLGAVLMYNTAFGLQLGKRNVGVFLHD